MISKAAVILSVVAMATAGVIQQSSGHGYAGEASGHGYASEASGHGYAGEASGHGYAGEAYGHEVAYAPVAHVAVAPIASYGGHEDSHVDYHAHPKYDYSYSVSDPHTGDHKTQHEVRDGDVVKGEYSLLQPDGSFRKVTYTADDHNGFNAVVHNTAPQIHHESYH